jgi:hypothetical protein
VWPFVPKPFKDELLSSWLTRTAKAHFTTVQGLFSKLWTGKSYYAKDIDIYAYNDEFWQTLSLVSGYSIKTIQSMRLTTLEGFVQEKIEPTGQQRWIIPIANYNRHHQKKRKQMCVRFCPECLRENGCYKKEWRLLFVNACLKHKCYLENMCPECKAPVMPVFAKEHLTPTQCYRCSFSLENTATKPIITSSYGLKAIKRLNKIAKNGYFTLGDRWHYSIGLFNVLRILLLPQQTNSYSLCCISNTWMLEKVSNFLWICY